MGVCGLTIPFIFPSHCLCIFRSSDASPLRYRVYAVKRLERRTAVILAAAVAVTLIFSVWIVQYIRYETPVKIGELAPDIAAHTIFEDHFMLHSLRGMPVLLNFFTTWCQPCIEETPTLITFANRHSSDIQVVMIDRADDAVLVRRFISQYHVPLSITVLLSPDDRWSPPFGVTGQPETFFIDLTGKIVSHLLGPITLQQMVVDAKVAGMRGS